MSLLEIITKASAEARELTPESTHPIILNPEQVLITLKPRDTSPNDTSSLVKRVEGWEISPSDSQIIESNEKFFKKLKRNLKNTNSFGKNEFIEMLNTYLEKLGSKIGVSGSGDVAKGVCGNASKLIEKVGFLMGRDVMGLVLEGSIVLECWELVETLIVNKLVEHSSFSNLIYDLIERKKSDLVCLCVKHLPDLQSGDIISILKYFLSPPIGAYETMVSVREEWENQALKAIEKAKDKKLNQKKLELARDASILLMVAHDEFLVSEMCLHYLLASSNVDEVVFSSCVSKLNGSEIMSLIKYLGKWLKKYERFPQAGPCPNASTKLGLKACDWVPTIGNVARCLGMVLDEHFSLLVLHKEFHEEMRNMEGLVGTLTSESKICSAIGNVIESLRAQVEG